MMSKLIFTEKNYQNIPESSGVYIFRSNKNEIIYVGKAKNLRKRIASYFSSKSTRNEKTNILVSSINTIEVIPVLSEFEALLLEAKLIKKYLPKFNTVLKDDKQYIYIAVTKEEFPRILISRKTDSQNFILFGPFPSAKTVREMLTIIRYIFPFCTQNPKIKRPCFYTHLGLCMPCPGEIKNLEPKARKEKTKEYKENIRKIINLLSGKSKQIENYLKKEMKKFSDKLNFENAAKIRDRLEKFKYLINDYHSPEKYITDPGLAMNLRIDEIKNLHAILQKYYPTAPYPHRIECYDISNIQGKLSAGSMVTFINGEPQKKFYRKFKIKTVFKTDDFRMIKEVIIRRLKHSEWSLPDLIVVDGGIPQLSALNQALSEHKIFLPTIGLAKKLEEIVIFDGKSYHQIKLPTSSPALHLVQRLRDEAHRFAHKYHEFLRLKYLTGI